MKQLFIYVLIHFCSLTAYTQSLDEVRKLIEKNDLPGAKKAIDKYLLDEKNAAGADGWYFKGVIYNECSKNDAAVNLCTNCLMEAFDAFKICQLLDPKNVYMQLEQNVRLFDIYNGFFDRASVLYASKIFSAAYENFGHALMVEDYILSKGFEYHGFKFSKLDTSLVLNMAMAARLAKMEKEAVFNYLRLAEINVSGPEYLEMYQYLAQYYIKTKNTSVLNNILEKAKKLYPDETYWTEVEIDQVDKKDKIALFAKYEEVTANNPRTYSVIYNYGVELFNYIYAGDYPPTDAKIKQAKIEEVLKNAIAIKNSADANLLMARHLYNKIFDLQEEMAKITGEKPEEINKKAALKTQTLNLTDDCIKYAVASEKMYTSATALKPPDKANYKNTLSVLENLYRFKGNTALAEEYQKKGSLL
jgi:hypothetical protein